LGVTENQRTTQSVESVEKDLPGDRTPASSREQSRRVDSWLAGPAIAIVAVVCYAGPLLLGVLAASGAGAWLAAHGYAIGAAALVAVAAFLAWRIRVRLVRG